MPSESDTIIKQLEDRARALTDEQRSVALSLAALRGAPLGELAETRSRSAQLASPSSGHSWAAALPAAVDAGDPAPAGDHEEVSSGANGGGRLVDVAFRGEDRLEERPVADDAGTPTTPKPSSDRWSRTAQGEQGASERTPPALESLSEPARLEALRTTGLLESESEGAFDRITRLTQQLLGVPSATVTLLDDRWQYFNSSVPRDGAYSRAAAIPASHSFCQHAVATGERLVVEDARSNLLVRESPVIEQQDVVAYAGQPLATSEGHVLGVLCAVGHEPRAWNEFELNVLSELAAVAALELDHRLGLHRVRRVEALVRRLAAPVEMLGDTIASLASVAHQVEAPLRLMRFAELAQRRFRAVEALERELIEAVPASVVAETHRTVDLAERLERAARISTVTARSQDLRVTAPGERVPIECDSYALDRALSHLFVTMLGHGEDSDCVEVTLQQGDGRACLEVRSPGHAIPTTDLTTFVSRLTAVVLPREVLSAGGAETCSIRLSGRTTVAQTHGVRATTGSAGTHVEVEFRLAPDTGHASTALAQV